MTSMPQSTIRMQNSGLSDDRSLRYLGVLVFGTLSVIGYLWLISDGLSFWHRTLSSLVCLLAVIPLGQFLMQSNRPIVPLMGLNCLFYFFAFGINGFFYPRENIVTLISLESYQQGVEMALIGLISQIVGYSIIRQSIGNSRPVTFVRGMTSEHLRLLAWGLVFLRLTSIAVPSITEIPTFGQFIVLTPYVTVGSLTMLALTKKLSHFETISFFCLFLPLELGYRVVSGAVYEPIILFILMALIYWIVLKRINWLFVILPLMVFVVFNPVKHQYRERYASWVQSESKNASSVEKIEYFLRLVSDYWLSENQSSISTERNLLNRLNHLAISAVVLESTPDPIPYATGDTLFNGFLAMVPRIIWRDKPSLGVANEFGRKYYIIDQNDYITTVNLSWITELFMNFGYYGVIIGMFMIGGIMSVLERWFATPGTPLIDIIIPLSINFQLVYPESNIALMWGGVATCTFAMYGLAWFIIATSGRRS